MLRRVEVQSQGIKNLEDYNKEAAYNLRTWEVSPVLDGSIPFDLDQDLLFPELRPQLVDIDADDPDPVLEDYPPATQNSQEPSQEHPIAYLPVSIPDALQPRTRQNGEIVGGEIALPHLFWMPDQAQWRPWNQFSATFQNEIVTVLRDTILKDPLQRQTWASISRTPVDRIDQTRYIAWKIPGKGNKAPVPSWNLSNGYSHFACDTCIKRKSPCIRLAVVPRFPGIVVAWYPLPEGQRQGVEQGTMQYYLRARDEGNTTTVTEYEKWI